MVCHKYSIMRFVTRPASSTLTIVIGVASLFAQQGQLTRLDGSQISSRQIDAVVIQLMQAAHVTGVGIAILNVVCFDGPKSGMLIMTNSSNGEDIYSGLLEKALGDTFTPLEWEGFKASSLK